MKKRYFLIILFILLVAALVPALSQKLEVSHWTLESGKLDRDARLAMLSDLHNSFYGDGQAELIMAINEAQVDAVLLAGDMADGIASMDGLIALVEGLGGRYPIYYVSGNHEGSDDHQLASIKHRLRQMNVRVLEGEGEYLRGDLWIAGADDPISLYRQAWQDQIDACRCEGDAFSLLLSHRPERHDFYNGFDLTLSGHAHGGQLRLLGQGLWSPNQGFLPRYTGGIHEIEDGRLFISRGLAKGLLPRLFNRPELAIIDLKAE